MSTTIADLVVKIGADITGFKNSVKQLENEFSGIVSAGEKMKGIGSTLSTYVTLPILAAGAAAVKMAVDVDKGVMEVVTLFNITGDEAERMAKRLKNGVSELSTELGIAQAAITEGLYDAISAGVPEENVFEFLKIAAQASIAGVTDIATAVDGITTSLNAYGLSATEAQRVSDSMFAAVQGGKTTFEELSNALFNVAPTAASLGVSLETVNAALATLTAAGFPTSVATTYLKAALGELGKEGSNAAKEFKNLTGKSFPEFIKGGGSLEDALKLLQKGAENSGKRLADMFGSAEAGNAVMVLATTGAEKFANELDRQAKSANSTQNAFDLMQKGTSAQFEKTMVMIQNIAIGVGDKILPALNGFLGIVQDLLIWFNNLNPALQSAIGIITGIAAAAGPVLYILGALATALPTLAAGFAILTGPIGLTVAAIAGVATAVYLIYDNWEGLVDWFEDTWYLIKMVHMVMVRDILEAIKPILDWIPGGQALYAGLSETINNAIDGAKVERQLQLVERSADKAATEAERLAKESEDAADGLEKAGEKGSESGPEIEDAFNKATESVKSLGEQVADVMSALMGDISQGERVLAFKVELTEETALNNKITALQTALTTLATDTTISIDDQQVIDLQTELTTAQGQLDAWKDAQIFKEGIQKAFETLAVEAGDLTTGELATLQTKIGELATQARTPEDFKAIVALNSSLDNALTHATNTETGITDMLEIADAQDKSFTALLDFQTALGTISATMTGEQALQAKIAAVWTAVGNGTIPLEEGEQLVKDYNDEWLRTRNIGADIVAGARTLFETSFPSLGSAIGDAETAFVNFRNAWTGEGEGTPLEKIGAGLSAVNSMIINAKNSMSEFGNVAGLAISGLDLLVPGLGTTISSVFGILDTLGLDVKNMLDSATNSLLNFIGAGGGGGSNPLLAEARNLAKGYKTDGLSQEEIAAKLVEVLGAQGLTESMAKAIAGEQFGGPKSGDDPMLKYLDWLGIWDNEGDAKARRAVSKLFADIINNRGLTSMGSIQEYMYNFLKDNRYEGYGGNVLDAAYWATEYVPALFGKLQEFGIDPASGGIPHLAKGGMAFGEMLAMVGDNPNASNDPEVISPLSKLNDMLVKPTLGAIASMMGSGGGSQQVIYVTLDGRVLAENTFYNMPDVVRVMTGGLQ